MKIFSVATFLCAAIMMASTYVVRVEAVFDSKRNRGVVGRVNSLASRKLGDPGYFGKALKHTKDWKNGKSDKSKSGKKSKKSKSDILDGDIFSDEFWESQCYFNYIGLNGADDYYGMDDYYGTDGDLTDMTELAKCVENFAMNTFLDIDTDKALDCSESMEKIAWQSYPSCFELRYYTPYVCQDLYQEFDKAYECVEDVIYEPPCYFDYVSEPFDGCAISFANAIGLDVEQVLNCTTDLFDVFEEQCYWNENSTEACDTFSQCESVLYGVDYCAHTTEIDLNYVTEFLEQELGVFNLLDTIYDGSIDVLEALAALEGYDDWNNTNGTGLDASEWSGFVECVTWELNYLIDDFCYLEQDLDIVGGCVELFADSFDLDVEALLTCDLDIEYQYMEKCEFSSVNHDVCVLVEQCVAGVYGINDCAESFLGLGFSDLSETLDDSEFGNNLLALYNGTMDVSTVFTGLVEYDGPMTEESLWEVFLICVSDYLTSEYI